MDNKTLAEKKSKPPIPKLAPGDTVKVTFKTVEGDKERTQHFQGIVIKIQRGSTAGSFTLRRSAYGVGVERTFFNMSPSVSKVEVIRHGQVRRAKLYYLRRLSAKEARLKERQEVLAEKAAISGAEPATASATEPMQASNEAPVPAAETSKPAESSKS
jgi:large subunit ribosomal protein L19